MTQETSLEPALPGVQYGMSGAPTFLPLRHPDYRRLAFHDQVKIVSMYTYHRDEYVQACKDSGFMALARKMDAKLDSALRKLEEGLIILDTLRSDGPPQPRQDYDLQVMKVWAAYRCNYQRKPWLPIDQHALKITHHYVVNVRLFNLPVLALSERGTVLWSWLIQSCSRSSPERLFRLLIFMSNLTKTVPIEDLREPRTEARHASGKFIKSWNQWNGEMEVYTQRAVELEEKLQLCNLKELWEQGYQVLDDAEEHGDRALKPVPSHMIYQGYRISRRFALLAQARTYEHRLYLPLVPEFWYFRARNFHIQDWDILR